MNEISPISRTSSAQTPASPAPASAASLPAPARKSGVAGAVVAGATGGILGLCTGATGVAQHDRAMGVAPPKPVAFLATCGTAWGPAIRGAAGSLGRGTAALVGPWSTVVTRLPEKLADLYGCMSSGFDATLIKRLPGTPYPPECVQLPLPGCPNPNAYRSADAAAPWIYAYLYVGIGIGVAGTIGMHAWRRWGPQDVIARCEGLVAAGDPEKTFIAGLLKKCDPCGLVGATEVSINRSFVNFAKRRVEARQSAAPQSQPLLQPSRDNAETV